MRYIEKRKPDYLFALLVFALVVFGLIMISSASLAISYEKFGRGDIYLIRQSLAFLFGIFVWIIFQSIDYHFFRKIALPLLFLTLLLLILVFIPGIGVAWKGVHRWLSLGPLSFQPAELSKLTLILYLATWFEKMGKRITSFTHSFLPFVFLLFVLLALLFSQPDIGTSVVIIGIAISIFFVAGGSIIHLLGLLASGFSVFLGIIFSAPYRIARISAYLNPEKDPLGIAYHIRNALIAIGSGGLWGLGFGMSRQKHLFLPEAHTDSIFAVIAEELGFIRAGILILVFLYLGYRGFRIAQKAPDSFGKLIATGITAWFIFQIFINLAGITTLLPFTGVPLPFISYGGTSLVVSLAAVGILLNISKHST